MKKKLEEIREIIESASAGDREALEKLLTLERVAREEIDEKRQYYHALLSLLEKNEERLVEEAKDRKIDPGALKKIVKYWQKLSNPTPDNKALLEKTLKAFFPAEMREYGDGPTIGIETRPYRLINFPEIARKIVTTQFRHLINGSIDALAEEAAFGEKERKHRSAWGKRGAQARRAAIESDRKRWLEAALYVKNGDPSLRTRSIATIVHKKLKPSQTLQTVYKFLLENNV